MVYAAESDPWYYPGTTVLRNKLGIEDQADLDEAELALFLTRADEPIPPGTLDYAHYRAIHHHLFQDVYDWAGEPRRIRISKNGNWFCFPEYIEGEMNRIFGELAERNHLVGHTAGDFANQAAHVLAEINAVHPFREGNGRTQLTFLAMLADNAGRQFKDEILDRDRVLDAMIASFSGNERSLAHLIADIVA